MKPGLGVGVMIIKEGKILLGLRNPNKEKASSELQGQGTWTMPGGKVEFMEKLVDAAKRELEEEAGYKSDNIEFLGAISPGPGYTDEIIYIYKATDLYKGIKGGDDDEFINVKSYKLSEIKNMIKEGIIFDAKTIASLMYI